MNILYINHYAGSPKLGMEYRPYYLAREWVKAGHSVTIVAASFAHTRQINPEIQAPVTHEEIDGIHYIWIKTPAYKGNGIGRILNMMAFVVGLLRYLPKYAAGWQPDVVIASSTYPLDFYPARRIAWKHNAKLVFELHDLWPLSPMELGGMSRFHPFIMVMQAAEDAWCRDCDTVVSILPDAEEHLRIRGLKSEKFFHIPNGIEETEWRDSSIPLPQEHQEYLARARSQSRFIIGYAGAHGVANALDALIEASVRLKAHPIDVVLVGTGPEKENLVAKAEAMGAEHVHFLGPLPKAAIPAWLSQLDGLYLGFQLCPLYRFGVSPNKLFDYLMAGKPIVYSSNASNDTVREAACGISVAAEDSHAIAEGILAIQGTSPEQRSDMGRRGRDFILSKHTYTVLAARFLEVMKPEHADA